MPYEAILSDRARLYLQRLSPADHAQVARCIAQLEQDPYPDASQRVTIVIPLQRIYRDAYRCGEWGIAFHVEAVFVIIDDIGRHILSP